MRPTLALILWVLGGSAMAVEMQNLGSFSIDRTEVSVADFAKFASATEFMSQAERRGGGEVYGFGWQQKPGWIWSHPFGTVADPDEPAVHLTFDEASQYCQWRGARLPTDAEWMQAAYTESRTQPSAPFQTGVTYPYPTGETPIGTNCLDGCGNVSHLGYADRLMRGSGPVRVGSTTAGVNGLYEMGANVWEWVDGGSPRARITRGGSWWYGPERMHRDDQATKPPDTAVVYIGFRCAKDN